MTARGDVGVIQVNQRAPLLPDLPPIQRCPRCRAWHGIPPLEALKPGDPCPHDPLRPCRVCGQPVGALSMGGADLCTRCDIGNGTRPRKESVMGGTETAAPKPGRGTVTKHAELTATQRIVSLLEPMTAEARSRVVSHATAILIELDEAKAAAAPPPAPPE